MKEHTRSPLTMGTLLLLIIMKMHLSLGLAFSMGTEDTDTLKHGWTRPPITIVIITATTSANIIYNMPGPRSVVCTYLTFASKSAIISPIL